MRATLSLLRLWIIFSSWAVLAGWGLGLTGHLNEKGYAWGLVSLAGFLIFAYFKLSFRFFPLASSFRRLFLLWKRGSVRPKSLLFSLPLLFVLVSLLSLLGGILYTPSNYDALSYRIPRLLHWLNAGCWHWITTPNSRQNFSAPGFEWLIAPLFVFFKSDRSFFLINWISFLLMPSLTFRTFCLAGISPKTCWWWMWLLPLGYGYVLQSGGIGNDAFATVYALASVCFVLSADKRERFSDFGWAILSVALLTGTKGSNLPLALPWFVAMLLRYRVWISNIPKLLPWMAVALMISFLPTAVLNHKYTGSWTGDSTNQTKVALTNPPAGLLGNSLMLGYCSLQPPLLFSPSKTNNLISSLVPAELKGWLLERFPRFELKIGEIPMEESAGLGLGLTACLALWIFNGRRSPIPLPSLRGQPWFFLGIAGLGSLLFYMAKMGSESTARLLLPYYPFLLLLPLGFYRSPKQPIPKIRWAFLFFASWVIVPLILSPARPLFPVQKLLTFMGDSPRFARVRQVYQAYMQRGTCWDPILTILPPNIKTLGFFSHGDDLEAPLWRPLGRRKVISISQEDFDLNNLPSSQAWLARRSVANLIQLNPSWNSKWIFGGSIFITQKASVGPEEWTLFLAR
jgi:hypothetical protein